MSRVTIVTGGGRGIGAAVVAELAADGHDVVVNYREDAVAAEGMAETARALGVRALCVRADVTRPDEVSGLFDRAAAELGAVTGLVNSAGATLHLADLADTPVDIMRAVVDANLLSALLCSREAVRRMSTRRGGAGGAIVSVSSVAATSGSPHEYVHYAAAKAGVDAMTVGLAKEVAAEGVRVNAVSPGPVETRIHADAGEPGRPARLAASIPMGRAGVPGDVAPAIRWLLSDEARYVTGANVKITGGL
ncbi:MAG: SDR family oxidoreductase [Actinomycetales bacterium]|nr:SDR family oxidoreductase [Actinomycetales bacterium]